MQRLLLAAGAALLLTAPASAQVAGQTADPAVSRVPTADAPAPEPEPAPPAGAIRLSLDEAIEIALERSYAIRGAALDVENARLQVREAYGGLFPRADATSSYSRNVVQANPFAGSSAGNIFGGLGAIGWLQYNETARTDGDPATMPISFQEYNQNIAEGYDAIGYTPADGSNPFGTDNSFQNTVAISQPLYSGTAFAAVRGAKALVDINRAAVDQTVDEVIHQTRTAFYDALLAQEQVRVVEASRQRADETASDFTQLVAQGVSPKLDRLNAEVDLANAETQLATARAAAQTITDQLLLTIGLPVNVPVILEGTLNVPDDDLFRTVATLEALEEAVEGRPDLEQARLAIRLNEVQRDITQAAAYPSLSAFANLGYNANVPDNRTSIFAPDPNDPFTFEESTEGFFSDAYWQPSVTVGLSLNWTLFDGFQTRRRVQQNQIAIDKAELQLEQATQAARLEVAAALRQLESAEQRLAAQAQTVTTAETAYAFAQERLDTGVASLVDVRLASQNLDTARLNFLQAVRDALVARSDYERATGAIAPEPVRPAEPTPTVPTTATRSTDPR
ncbi:MAG TPA: TolC family protein [Bacteroidetes bacterium]|nr:TolC family protein [Bacteroidota bacterium]HIL57791.1 TolC family protein [Rhodothermales bacterium]